jgi:hypothetical protein
MKIAFCFSGQPRDVKKTLDNILWAWGTHQELDFFVHTWIPEKPGTFRPDTPSDTFDDDTLEYILEKLNPKKYKFEHQITFTKVYPDSRNWPVGNPWSIPNPSQNIQSFFYSVQQANNLKKQYEIENNFTYDCVIRTRFDYLFMKQYDITEYDLNYLHVKDDCTHTEYALNDHVGMSNSYTMDVYSDMFEYLEECYNDKIEFNTEVLWGYYIQIKKKLKVAKTLGKNESYLSTVKERWSSWGMSPQHDILDI